MKMLPIIYTNPAGCSAHPNHRYIAAELGNLQCAHPGFNAVFVTISSWRRLINHLLTMTSYRMLRIGVQGRGFR